MKCKRTKQAFLTIFLLCLLLVSAFGFLRLGVWQIKPAKATEIFSDGFESGDFTAWTANSTGSVQNTVKNTGIYAANLTISYTGSTVTKDITGVTEVYVRFYWRNSVVLSDGDETQVCFLGTTIAETQVICNILRNSTGLFWKLQYRDAGGWLYASYLTSATETSWQCLEIRNKIDASAGIEELWENGTKIIDDTGLSNNDRGVTCSRIRLDATKISGNSGYDYYDDVVIADSYVGPIAPSLTQGDGVASTWDYRVSDNATSCYLINKTGTILDNHSDPVVVINWGLWNCDSVGGGSVYLYTDSYLTSTKIGSSGMINPDDLNNVYLDLGGSTITRTSGGGSGDFMVYLWGYDAGSYNFTLTSSYSNGTATLDGNYLANAMCLFGISNSTFSNIKFQHGYGGGYGAAGSSIAQVRCTRNVWENITLYNYANSAYAGGMLNSCVSYSNFTDIYIHGIDTNWNRYGFYFGDWDVAYGFDNSSFNRVTRLWIDTVWRDGIYLNSGATGYGVFNNTFTNCTMENNWGSGYEAIKLRPAQNNTFTDIIIRNFTGAVTTGTSYLESETAGNCTGNYVEARIYGSTVTSLILTSDGDNQEVSGNFFNLTTENGKGTYFSHATNSPIQNNIVYMNFTDCTSAIYLEQGNISDNTFYLNFTRCGSGGHPDIWHWAGWTNITGNIFNVYATSGNPNGLMDFVNGTQGNLVFYPYVGGGPVTVSVFIVSPTNTTYSSSTVSVELYASGGTIDTIWWNCKSGASWVYGTNQTYTAPTSMTGLGNGTYTFYGWANNTDGDTGYSTVTFTVAFKTTRMATTELINAYGITTSQINTFLALLQAQNITRFTFRINSMYEWDDSPPTMTGINKAKTVITAANALGIDVAIDLHTWYTTWDQRFDDSASGHDANRVTYINYVKATLTSFASSNVYAFMVLNEPQAQTASSDENQFILDVIAAAKTVTTKPISVRFMGGHSPTSSPQDYATAIDTASDFWCRNYFWDPRYPTVSVYQVSQARITSDIALAHAAEKELWITECGWSKSTGSSWTSANLENQRAYAEAMVGWCNAHDVDLMSLWVSQPTATDNTENYNLFTSGSWTPHPAFYELINEEGEEPPLGDNVVLLNQPNNLETFDYFNILFNYTATFYQGSIVNASLWTNRTGSWALTQSNTTAIVNGTMHTISYTFIAETTYIWNIRVFNSTTAHWAFANRTFTIETTPPEDDPPTYGTYSVSSTAVGAEAIFQLSWWDDVSLVYGWLGHNSSGIWVNETVVPMFTPHLTFSDVITLPSSAGIVVGFRFYANDTAGQENATAIYTLTTMRLSSTYHLPSDTVIRKGLKVHFGPYWISTSETDIHIMVWCIVDWINYTVDSGGSQQIYTSFKPTFVYLDGILKAEGDGWSYYGGTITAVTGATFDVAVCWGVGGASAVAVTVTSPTNTTYTTSTIPVQISATGGTIDKIWYNCKNASSWVYGSNQTYTAPTSMTGFVNGTSYTFYAWANNTDGNWNQETAMFTVQIITANHYYLNFGFYDLDINDVESHITWQLLRGIEVLTYVEGQATLESGTYTLKTYYHTSLINQTVLNTATYGNTTANIYLQFKAYAYGYLAFNNTVTGLILHSQSMYNLTFTLLGSTPMTMTIDFPYSPTYIFKDGIIQADWTYTDGYIVLTASSLSVWQIIYGPPFVFPTGAYYYFITGTRTTNNATGYRLDPSSGFALSTITQTNAGNCSVSYAFQVSIVKHDGSLIDLTGITAIITRSDMAEGFQNGYATISYTSLVLGYQALRVRLYICFDGGAWYATSDYVTSVLVEKAVDTSTWNFTVYTKRSYDVGTDVTSAQFMFGDQSHKSRIGNVAFIDPLAQEIALWKLESGDIIGGVLYPFMLYTGDLIYGLGIMFVSGVLYLRHKKWEVILVCSLLYAGGSGIGYLIPDVAYRLVYIIIWFVLTIVLYRVFR